MRDGLISVNHDAMCVVDDVTTILRRLSAQCHLYAFFMDNPPGDTVSLCDVAEVMALIRDNLDEQIKALDEINWNPGKGARA